MNDSARRQLSDYWVKCTFVSLAFAISAVWRKLPTGKIVVPLDTVGSKNPYVSIDGRLAGAVIVATCLMALSLGVLSFIVKVILPHIDNGATEKTDFDAGVKAKFRNVSGYVKVRALGIFGAFFTIFVLTVATVLVLKRWG